MRFSLLLLLCLTACTPGGAFHVHTENDYFDPFHKNSDKYYTNGAKFTYDRPAERNGETTSYSLGQNIYTPEHKHFPNPPEQERPYASYLYGEYAQSTYKTPLEKSRWAIQAGTIGPNSYGEEVQTGFHRLVGQGGASGWGYQLHNEPTGELLYDFWRRRELYNWLDAIGGYGGRVGNVFDAANLTGTLRLGIVGQDFGTPDITPRVQNPTSQSEVYERFASYVFVGTEGRAVARNIFLDGNTFRYSRRVTKEPFVADLKFGFVVDYNSYRLSYTFIHITREWKELPSSQDFGSIDISWGW